MRVKAGARGTFFRCTFQLNEAKTGDANKRAVGPAVGLKSTPANGGADMPAAAWFHSCSFLDNRNELDGVDVSVTSSSCTVITNTVLPRVFNVDSGKVVEPIMVKEGGDGGAEAVFPQSPTAFLTEGDPWFLAAATVRPHLRTFVRLACLPLCAPHNIEICDLLERGKPRGGGTERAGRVTLRTCRK